MRVLLTGASSFTGAWFATTLANEGHEVTVTLRHPPDDYSEPLRRERAQKVRDTCRVVVGPRFGDAAFLELVKSEKWDLLAYNGADVRNYRSPEFDVTTAVADNTRSLPAVLEGLASRGSRAVLLTGSVFEGGEGAGSQGLPDFSPYGLSKRLTAEIFRFYCTRFGLSLGKFVIPNPFGPLEEARYTAYLMTTWLKGETASCNSPSYVRDNIHVSLLALAYANFARSLTASPGFMKLGPLGYAESQGAFTLRLSAAMEARLNRPCKVDLKIQKEFSEPHVRVNTDILNYGSLGWSEEKAWDDFAAYYTKRGTPK